MPSIFDESSWPIERAILHICFNISDPRAMRGDYFHVDLIRAWIADPVRKQAPTDDDRMHSRIKAFADKARELWGEDAKTMDMHPMLWSWFVMSKLKSKVRQTFWLRLEKWITQHVVQGRLPMVQRKAADQISWAELRPISAQPDLESGLPAATLIYRKFEKPDPACRWRTALWSIGSATNKNLQRSRQQRSKRLDVGHEPVIVRTSRSPGCEALLTQALSAASRLTKKIERVSEPQEGGVLFQAPELYQADLLDWIKKTRFHTELSNYSGLTIARSLSAMVECCRGRKLGSTNGASKLGR